MSLRSDDLLEVLKAIGEPTRLRIVALLRHGELTVSDLTDILGQSQPRISRHLKLLAEAGVVHRNREGAWAFFDLVASDHEIVINATRCPINAIQHLLHRDVPSVGSRKDDSLCIQQFTFFELFEPTSPTKSCLFT